jgi:hypothetical protein
MNDEPFEDLRAALECGASLELSDEQRAELKSLCYAGYDAAKLPLTQPIARTRP